ncbi:MAG: type I-B CRISPR-associated protein Cas8b1/Cst1 [Deltaproteobacteria bacterium]|nr:type I-B CRISPR-associated protein Cas8b1/Cst1 [Deltaproteobacteria bacterium]
MPSFTGHPLVDVGLATITAFAGKTRPEDLSEQDYDAIADYMAQNYVVNPLKSFLTVAFPNSGFTQPAFEKTPERREAYAERVLRGYRRRTPALSGERCVFTGLPPIGLALDDKNKLPPGRAFRQHIPMVTGEDVINFHPYGDAGIPVSGIALLAIQAFPLGCSKVAGKLLAVHSDDEDLMVCFAKRFLQANRKHILAAQAAELKKLPEPTHRVGTLLVGSLLEIEDERLATGRDPEIPASVTAYHLSNSGQGVDLSIYHLPLEVGGFLRLALTPRYRQQWDKIRQRGWEIVAARKKAKKGSAEPEPPSYNTLYEDLLRLPDNTSVFIRTYFLRTPQRTRRPGDPRAEYSIRGETDLISWPLTEQFLRKVVLMDQVRINHIRTLGDRLAHYVKEENDRRFFHTFLTTNRYTDLRLALIKAGHARVRKGQAPLITFDQFIAVFEQGENLPQQDWRFARDLVLIRMIEQLYQSGWVKEHADELGEVEDSAEAINS